MLSHSHSTRATIRVVYHPPIAQNEDGPALVADSASSYPLEDPFAVDFEDEAAPMAAELGAFFTGVGK